MKNKAKYGIPLNLKETSLEEVVSRVASVERKDGDTEPDPNAVVFEGEQQLALFKNKIIHKVFHNNEWFFAVVDVVEAITGTDRPRQYWGDLKRQLSEKEGFKEVYDKIVQIKMPSPDGKMRMRDAVNVETLFRIIQSVPSPTAEPFKRWLARVGYERIEEFQNPEIGVKRAIVNWQLQGRSDDWIEARLRAIIVRHELTSEWSKRGIEEGMEYGYLTNIISEETFGLKTGEHKVLKGLTSQNLRDHMTDFELVLTMLGEKSTAAIAQTIDAQGLEENAVAAHSGGKIAGDARKGLEQKLQRSVVSKENFLKPKKDQRPLG